VEVVSEDDLRLERRLRGLPAQALGDAWLDDRRSAVL